MGKKRSNHPTRREAILEILSGFAGAAFALALPLSKRGATKEETVKKLSNRNASYYKRLAG